MTPRSTAIPIQRNIGIASISGGAPKTAVSRGLSAIVALAASLAPLLAHRRSCLFRWQAPSAVGCDRQSGRQSEEVRRATYRRILQADEGRRAAHARIHSQIPGSLQKHIVRRVDQLFGQALEHALERGHSLNGRCYLLTHVNPSMSST